ncbi:tetratricopeptide repeat protein [Candidatus Peregrinibacteria bacterium]|nr:tetratricopeptide repeat protein [Candidatus Peregrinibacteria bacterium]
MTDTPKPLGEVIEAEAESFAAQNTDKAGLIREYAKKARMIANDAIRQNPYPVTRREMVEAVDMICAMLNQNGELSSMMEGMGENLRNGILRIRDLLRYQVLSEETEWKEEQFLPETDPAISEMDALDFIDGIEEVLQQGQCEMQAIEMCRHYIGESKNPLGIAMVTQKMAKIYEYFLYEEEVGDAAGPMQKNYKSALEWYRQAAEDKKAPLSDRAMAFTFMSELMSREDLIEIHDSHQALRARQEAIRLLQELAEQWEKSAKDDNNENIEGIYNNLAVLCMENGEKGLARKYMKKIIAFFGDTAISPLTKENYHGIVGMLPREQKRAALIFTVCLFNIFLLAVLMEQEFKWFTKGKDCISRLADGFKVKDEEIKKAYDSKNYTECIRLCEEALELNLSLKNKAWLKYVHAVSLHQIGRTGDALVIFKEIEGEFKGDTRYWVELGGIYWKLGNYKEGVDSYEKASKLKPENQHLRELQEKSRNIFEKGGGMKKAPPPLAPQPKKPPYHRKQPGQRR